MSVHLTNRGTGYMVQTGSSRDEDVPVYGGVGNGLNGKTITGQSLAGTQRAVRLRGDAADGASVAEVTVDGGTTWESLATYGFGQRVVLNWSAGARGKPGLNADIQNSAEATRMVTDAEFEILGTNASSDDVTYGAEGGIVFTTDGADADSVILLPHLDANQSQWTQVTWGTDKETRWACAIATGADITNSIVYAGLKMTNTNVTATDDDQVFFRYQSGVNDGEWQVVSSVGGTDDAHDTSVVVAVSTLYVLEIAINAARVASFFINGVLVETSAALTDAVDLIPYVGVVASGAAEAKTLTVYGQRISRTVG